MVVHVPPAGCHNADGNRSAGQRVSRRSAAVCGSRFRAVVARLGGQRHCLARSQSGLAQSYERIHRSNLVGVGVLPLEFKPGESASSLGLTGHEAFDIEGLGDEIRSRQELTVTARAAGGTTKSFRVLGRLDSPVEVKYYRNGGILQTVLRSLLDSRQSR